MRRFARDLWKNHVLSFAVLAVAATLTGLFAGGSSEIRGQIDPRRVEEIGNAWLGFSAFLFGTLSLLPFGVGFWALSETTNRIMETWRRFRYGDRQRRSQKIVTRLLALPVFALRGIYFAIGGLFVFFVLPIFALALLHGSGDTELGWGVHVVTLLILPSPIFWFLLLRELDVPERAMRKTKASLWTVGIALAFFYYIPRAPLVTAYLHGKQNGGAGDASYYLSFYSDRPILFFGFLATSTLMFVVIYRKAEEAKRSLAAINRVTP